MLNKMFKCILCNSTELLYVMNSRDNSEKKIYDCKKCNMRQLYPRITNNEEILKNGKLEKQDLLRITSEMDKNNSGIINLIAIIIYFKVNLLLISKL